MNYVKKYENLRIEDFKKEVTNEKYMQFEYARLVNGNIEISCLYVVSFEICYEKI